MLRRILALGVALLCGSCSACAASIQFGARQDIATKFQKLTGLAVADFNGDGKPDIAVTDVYSQNISVYLNDGTGHFRSPVITQLSVSGIGGLGGLVTGDVNEDGKQDLIVAPVAGNQVDIVLLGNGDGTFKQAGVVPGSYGFPHAKLVDLNGDKHLDLVSAGNGNVYAALGDGKGNFTQLPVNAPANIINYYPDLAVGDFNGDKMPDFVTIGYNTGGLLFFPGTSGGSFTAPTVTQPANVFSPYSVTAADFNNDGKLDLVIGSANIATLFYGNGDGTFQIGAGQEKALPFPFTPGATFAITPPVVASADMNADGKIDIVSADDTSNMVSVLLNDGSGKFPQTHPDFSAALDPGVAELRLVDLNGDGLPDIVVTNYKTQNISIFLSVVPLTTATVTLQSSAAQALVGSSVTVSVQVGGSASQSPTGTVTLSSGNNSFGQQTIDSTGKASFVLPNLPVGQYALTASYSGDKYNSAATNSAAFTESITDFQLAVPTATQSVAVGASATYSVSLTPLSGFTGTLSLACSGLPTGFACAPLSPTVGAQATTASVVVTPPATAASFAHPTSLRASPRVMFAFLGFSALCFGFRSRRRLPALIVAFACLSTLTSGCSSSGSAKPAAYTGTSTFTITATAVQGSTTVSHQTTATLTVHQ